MIDRYIGLGTGMGTIFHVDTKDLNNPVLVHRWDSTYVVPGLRFTTIYLHQSP